MADIAKDSAASTPRTIYLKDYQVPDYLVDTVELRFELEPAATRVSSRLTVRFHPDVHKDNRQLVLHGQALTLIEIRIDGNLLSDADYTLSLIHI